MTVTNISNTTYNIDEHSFVNSALYLNNIEGAIAAGEQAPTEDPEIIVKLNPKHVITVKKNIQHSKGELK